MADNKAFDAVSFGIHDTQIVGDVEHLEDFLSDDVEKVVKKDSTVEKLKPTEKVESKEATEEKEIKKEDVMDDFLGKEEETSTTQEEKIEEKEQKEEVKEDDNTWTSLSNELYRIGTFTGEEGESVEVATTPEEFRDLFEKQKQKGASQWLNAFLSSEGQDKIELFEAIFVNKVDSREYLQTYNEILDLKEMDLEDEDNQKTVFKEYYKRQGFDNNKISARLEKAIDRGDLADDAKDFHERIVAQDEESLEQQKIEAQKNTQRKQEKEIAYRTSISKILNEKVKTKELNGIPLNEEIAKKAFDYLNTPKWQMADGGQKLTDFDKFILDTQLPENHEKRLMITLLALSDFDMSKIKKKGISEESNQLFSKLKKDDNKTKTIVSSNNRKIEHTPWVAQL